MRRETAYRCTFSYYITSELDGGWNWTEKTTIPSLGGTHGHGQMMMMMIFFYLAHSRTQEHHGSSQSSQTELMNGSRWQAVYQFLIFRPGKIEEFNNENRNVRFVSKLLSFWITPLEQSRVSTDFCFLCRLPSVDNLSRRFLLDVH